MKLRLQNLLLYVLSVSGALLAGTGCTSMSQPMSASFASVVISGATAEEVREEATNVFKAEEWHGGGAPDGTLEFEREGSKFDHVAYGSNVLTEMPVMNRVRLQLVPLADGTQRLQCQAYVIRDRGGHMDDEIRMKSLRAGPYQQLLDKVAAHFIGRTK